MRNRLLLLMCLLGITTIVPVTAGADVKETPDNSFDVRIERYDEAKDDSGRNFFIMSGGKKYRVNRDGSWTEEKTGPQADRDWEYEEDQYDDRYEDDAIDEYDFYYDEDGIAYYDEQGGLVDDGFYYDERPECPWEEHDGAWMPSMKDLGKRAGEKMSDGARHKLRKYSVMNEAGQTVGTLVVNGTGHGVFLDDAEDRIVHVSGRAIDSTRRGMHGFDRDDLEDVDIETLNRMGLTEDPVPRCDDEDIDIETLDRMSADEEFDELLDGQFHIVN